MAIDFANLPDEVREGTIYVPDVPLGVMFVAERDEFGGYARPQNDRRVEKLTAEFDPNAVGVLLVSMREDGTYAIIDGRHRWKAALNNNVESLACLVFLDLTIQEEAALYRKYGDYLKQTALDRYIAAQTEENPEVLAIDRLLDEVGLHVSRTGGPEAGGIMAVGAIQDIAKQLGPQVLRDTLRLMHDAYGTNRKAYTSQTISGTAQFIIRYLKHPKFQRTRLIDAMRSQGVHGVIAQSNAIKAAEHTSAGNSWGRALAFFHDFGIKKEENRLIRENAGWPSQVMTEAGKAVTRRNVKEFAKPAADQARRRAVAKKAKMQAACVHCRAEPGADCRNVRGQSLNDEVHNERYDALRKIQAAVRAQRYKNGKAS